MGQESTKATIYSGTFERSLDAKNRVAIPSAWVTGEGEEFHVVPNPNGAQLLVMGREELSSYKQKFQDLTSLTAGQRQSAIRAFFGAAHAVSTDKQGRIVLPEKHRERAGLGGEVVFIGVGSHFEIWSKARHEAEATDSLATFQLAATEIGL